MRSCQAAIEMISSKPTPPKASTTTITTTTNNNPVREGDMEIEKESEGDGDSQIQDEMRGKFPRMGENAWMLLMLISKVSMM